MDFFSNLHHLGQMNQGKVIITENVAYKSLISFVAEMEIYEMSISRQRIAGKEWIIMVKKLFLCSLG